jgi:hypothetical protein
LLSCKEVLERHSEFIDGEMPSVDAELWRTHLANCAACARYDRVLRKGVGVLRADRIEPDAEFMLHLRYRMAYEEQRIAMGPVTAGAATSVTVAAVLALAAWLPIMLMSRQRETTPLVEVLATDIDPAASAIAWHGSSAIAAPERSPQPLTVPSSTSREANTPVKFIDRGYSPLILEAPTAPPSYSQPTFTSLSAR